ncbi:CaiB/BaiF CoA transferase family protein [Rhodococcus opacus]|uniref:Carnitine dehydratase n=1 Tax=Rhodococcus opacus TaxID=37919 RepID=A0A076F3V2_RHOOP|nr:CaiB/BaiF CoA-transferase family protein [Rhodococcus opacus]AII10469.1 carnitine dehydratase [Rhodococcus opacus]
MTGLPLAGVTVVSVEQAVAAPFATRQLADLGARVIKVERPDGGDFARQYDETVKGSSSYFVWLNRAKESITLDLKQPGGRAILDELLAGADVFVQNLAPGAVQRMGLDAVSLADAHPSLIMCNVSGYGTGGPWDARKAYDLLIQSEVGLVSITGNPDSVAKVGISIADIAAGMYAYSGILSALYARAQTGIVNSVDVSLFDALAEWMSAPANYTKYGGRAPARTGARHATIAPYGPHTTRDGKQIVLAIQNEREWASFCTIVMDSPRLAGDPSFGRNSLRVANDARLRSLIDERFGALAYREARDLLDRAGIAYADVNSIDEFLDHPVLATRGRWQTVDTPGGPVEALKPPAILSRTPPHMGSVPYLGQHTDAILRGLGRSESDISRLRDDAAV